MGRVTVALPDNFLVELRLQAAKNGRNLSSEIAWQLMHAASASITLHQSASPSINLHQPASSSIILHQPSEGSATDRPSEMVLAADALAGSGRQAEQVKSLEAAWRYFFPGAQVPSRFFPEWLGLADGKAEGVYLKMDETASKGTEIRSPSGYVRQLLQAEREKAHAADKWVEGVGWVSPEEVHRLTLEAMPDHWKESA